LNKPEQTKAAFTEDGWLRTGDLGVMNDGVLSIVGRSKELIRSGGYNILPSEVEVALQEHPAVVLAFVGGVPDAVYGETVHAALQLSHDNAVSETQLRDHLRQRVSAFKIPKRFDCRTALPLLANGKIDRSRLLSELRASAELQQTEAK
jgi:acyl-CoA synthetase (AMP-forming)/AMP-acid ligase II